VRATGETERRRVVLGVAELCLSGLGREVRQLRGSGASRPASLLPCLVGVLAVVPVQFERFLPHRAATRHRRSQTTSRCWSCRRRAERACGRRVGRGIRGSGRCQSVLERGVAELVSGADGAENVAFARVFEEPAEA
jgi:hypothetical protein